jgi:hypothetical protein
LDFPELEFNRKMAWVSLLECRIQCSQQHNRFLVGSAEPLMPVQ